MVKLKNILKEWTEKSTGPKRWFKPYGDKYTEYEKSTNENINEFVGVMTVGLLMKYLKDWTKKNPQYVDKLKDFVSKL